MAEHMYPIMTPATSSVDMVESRRLMRRMKPVDIMEPTKAAMISTVEDMAPKWVMKKIIAIATTSFAPWEIPSTKGPAIGLAKNVCSRKPESASAPPSSAAVRMRGMRIRQMMLTDAVSPCRVKRILAMSRIGIGTLPILMFKTTITAAAKIRPTNTAS